MNKELFLLILGMGIVTYIPRMVPMIFLKEIKLPAFIKRFLEFVPYSILASLIFPGILSSVQNIQSAIVGAALSIGLSLLRLNLIFVVFGGILGVYLTELLFF
jgi:branched-subunit amino acid transport protein